MDIQERINELSQLLDQICGTSGNTCNTCPYEKECEEYCELEQIKKIINK